MDDLKFIVREPLLDPKQRVLGYELRWHQSPNDAADLPAMASILRERFGGIEDWSGGDGLIFLNAQPSVLNDPYLHALPPANIVLTLRMADLAEPAVLDAVKQLRERGFGICLREANAIAQDKSLLPFISHLEIQFASTDLPTQARIYGALKQSPVRMLAREIGSWQEFDSCASLGLSAFVGKLHLTVRPDVKSKGVNPTQTLILQLMDMVGKNADARQLETVLKRDAALSYKLLRYINSSGFGLGTEIQSLRHAVTLLGYSALYRWLSVLLATASANAQSQVLMQSAVLRGRFAELLGQGFLPKSEAENLFVAGMFSLLDRLLGVPMEEVLEHVQLSEPIVQALLHREGMYGPFLALAEACEAGGGKIAPLADSLFISPHQVNEAHLTALKWAVNLKL
jgi:c-di-GMP-related signal transduction protein